MYSNLAQKFKRDNHYSNINNLYTMFKGTLILITEVWKWDGTINFFYHLMLLMEKSPYGSKWILRHYRYWSNPKLGSSIVAIRIIPCSIHAKTAILYLYWDSKTKEAVNQTRYGRVSNLQILKYSWL